MKNISPFLLIAAGGALILNSAFFMLVSNFNIGMLIMLILGTASLFSGLFYKKLRKWTSHGVLKIVRYAFITGVMFFIATALFIGIYGCKETVDFKEDSVIILGAAIRGTVPSLPLVRRLEAGYAYHCKNPEAYIVVSGGQGMQEDIPEAEAMRRYLSARGVPEEKIIKEERATSTFQNFTYSKEILDDMFNEPYTSAFITNNFHLYRANYLAKYVGLNATYKGAKTELYTLPINYLRETLAVIKTWVMGK